VQITRGACDPAPDVPSRKVEKRRELYMDVIGAQRGCGFHASRVLERVDACRMLADASIGIDIAGVHFVVSLDKMGRRDVDQWVPAVNILTGLPLEWDESWCDARVGRQFVVSAWQSDGKNKSIEAASWIKRDSHGGLMYVGERAAKAALAATVPEVTGVPLEELRSAKLSGLHWVRHFAGELSEHLEWPESDGNVLWDWADPASDDQASAPKKAKRPGTRQKFYAPNATFARQMKVRARFYSAVAAGFTNFGVENVTRDTTWDDIFPKPPPAALAVFYGPA